MPTSKLQLPIAVGCVVDDNKRVLLIRRSEPGIPHIHDKLELPGGKVEFGENPAKTAEREVLEETGFYVSAVRMLPFSYVAVRDCGDHEINPVILCFRCELLTASARLQPLPPKVKEARWMEIAEIDPLQTQSGTFQFLRHVLTEENVLSNVEIENYEKSLSIAYVNLRSVDNAKNRNRFYNITVETNIVADPPFRVHAVWGRASTRWSQSSLQQFTNRDDALDYVRDILIHRRKSGYYISDCSSNFPNFPVLSDMPVWKDSQPSLF